MAEPTKPTSRPRISIDRLDSDFPELAGRVPIVGTLARVMAGPDRPDYCLIALDQAIPFVPPEGFDWEATQPQDRGTTSTGVKFLWIPAVIICSRIVGDQISATMRDMQVNLAYVTDMSLGRDESVDFAKLFFASIASATTLPEADAEEASGIR